MTATAPTPPIVRELEPPRPLVFVDVETTGLDPAVHGVWEVALVDEGGDVAAHFGIDVHEWRGLVAATRGGPTVERQWQPLTDREALEVGGYHDRIGALLRPGEEGVARIVHQLTDGVHLVGANPAFDAAFLTAMLGRHGLAPAWHHRLVDVETLAVGWWHGIRDAEDLDRSDVPWRPQSLSDTARELGIDVDAYDRHTAVDDALLAREVWLHVTGQAVTA